MIRFIASKGFTTPSLRNEIYTQIIKQLINNPRMYVFNSFIYIFIYFCF